MTGGVKWIHYVNDQNEYTRLLKYTLNLMLPTRQNVPQAVKRYQVILLDFMLCEWSTHTWKH